MLTAVQLAYLFICCAGVPLSHSSYTQANGDQQRATTLKNRNFLWHFNSD